MKQILYYSWNGKTRHCAQTAGRLLNAPVTEIVERCPRKKGVLGFLRAGYEASKQKHADIQMLPSLDGEMVVLVFPVWASKTPPAINTALRTLDFAGRQVVAIITMGGPTKHIPCYDIVGDLVRQRGGALAGIIPVVTGRTEEDQWDADIRQGLARLGLLTV